MKVLITGSTGLIGSELFARLQADGHAVGRLLRQSCSNVSEREHFWSPTEGQLSADILTNYEGVVHLAGAPIMSGRLTSARKRILWNSRIKSMKLLVDRLAELQTDQRPKVLVSASAIGYYPYGDRPMDESTAAATEGFISELCQAWEAAAEAAAGHGLRVVRLRIGLVLSPKGGMLRAMYRMQRLGLGMVLGSGKQYVSWIHIEDILRLITKALLDNNWQGVYNATSPQPVSHRNLVRALASVSRRSTWLPAVPSWLLRAALGELSDLILKSQYILPSRSLAEGFRFHFDALPTALDDLLMTSTLS